MRSEKIKEFELKELFYNNQKCEYCGVDLNEKDFQIDHKIPLSRNGKHSIDNLAISCKECNNLKGTMTSEEFLIFIKIYIKRFV